MGTINWATDRTAAEWATLAADLRQQAADRNRRSAESRDRSDTDGFLSQWAADQMADRYRGQAEVAEHQGVAEQLALFRDGVALPTEMVEGNWGPQWAVKESYDFGARTVAWVTVSQAATPAKEAAFYARKGYTLGTVKVRVGFADRNDRMYTLPGTSVEVVAIDSLAVSA